MRDGYESKILMVGFDQYGEQMYPHLFYTLHELNKYFTVEYFQLPERGWGLANRGLSGIIRSFVKSMLRIIILRLRVPTPQKVIAIDFFAYALCSLFFDSSRVIIWSHDFYMSDQRGYFSPLVRIMHILAGWYLQKNGKIIIQDDLRMTDLIESFRIKSFSKVECVLYPVCLPNALAENKTREGLPVLLQSGAICETRHSKSLIEHYSVHYEKYVLMLQGNVEPSLIAMISDLPVQPTVLTKMLPQNIMSTITARCDVGFVGYQCNQKNNYHVSMASGQTVEFLRMSKPVISIGNNNLGEFLERHYAGVKIDEMSQLDDAIAKIMSRYEYYCEKAHECYKAYFNIENNVKSVIDMLCCDDLGGGCLARGNEKSY